MLHTIGRRLTPFQTSKLLLVMIATVSCLIYLNNQLSFANINQQVNNASETTNETITIDRELFDYLAFHLRDRPYDGVHNYTRFMTAALGLKAMTGVQPLVPGMGQVVNDIRAFQYPINIGPCQSKSRKGVGLFVATISAPNNTGKRAVVRQTWVNHLKNQSNVDKPLDIVGFGFVVGLTSDVQVQQQIRRESEKYGDILQINVEDKYVDLSIKVGAVLNWIHQFCGHVDYFLKADDDVYVNVHNLATILHSLNPSEPSMYGRKCGEVIPSRTTGKWATSFQQWPWENFPLYFNGAGILMTGTAILPLLSAVQTTPYFVWDDMYLVALCAAKAGVHLYASDNFFINIPEHYEDRCFVRKSLTWTTQSAHDMNVSHIINQGLYHNKPITVNCITAFNNTNTTLIGPAIVSEFNITKIQ